MNTSHYAMLIEWSDEDLAFLVTLPEWAERVIQPVTHGDTYEEAVKNGHEVLEMLIEQWSGRLKPRLEGVPPRNPPTPG